MIVKNLVKKTLIWGGLLMVFISHSHAETISPRRLLEVADLSGPVISPNGSSVAFRLEQASIVRNTYDNFWYVQAMDGKSPPRRVADGGVLLHTTSGVSVPGHAEWSPGGRWIYYRALVDGQIAVWRAAVDGSGAEPVTSDPADVRDFALSTDGKTLKYIVGATRDAVIAAEQAEYDNGIHVDDTVPVGQGGLFRSGNIDGRLETQRFLSGAEGWGRTPLLAGIPDQWKAVDLETRKTRDLSSSERPPKPPTASELPGALPTPEELAVDPDTGRIALLTRIGNRGGLRRKPDVQLAMLPKIGSSRTIKCQTELCTGKAINAIQWRPHSDEVLFTVTDPHEGQAQSIYRWNVRTGAVHLVTQSTGLLSGSRYQSGDCGVSSEALVCVAAEANRPPRLERIDLMTGGRQVLFDPNVALALDMAKTAPSRLLRWTDAKGQEFTGQFFPARGTDHGPSPLFVTYYDCTGFLRGGLGDEWPLASLAGEGISALCINMAPYRLDAIERYGQGLSAVRSVIDLLASKGEIDRTKVGMGGLSLGTEVTLWTVMKSDLLTAASVTSVGMSRNYYLFSSMRGKAFAKELQEFWQLGAPGETPNRWRILSPAANLDTIKAPILMQMPEQEYVVALDYAIPLMHDHRADLYVFPNEPHLKFQPKHKLAAYERNLDWFRFWLQGYEDPNPVKKQQYTHWREMRGAVAAKSVPGSARSGG
ncbi:dipeptidyl aminopeptidase [Rhodanobacter sp. B05]|uniref:Atxe2 family lasso peptide isopeptidase n=1 Tax=Rhodanobacter sp. B05 TaxID=1945859 RepID=UPI000985E2B6|nr:Atxe2 family lasso peptide isopeptidase [Rhodanobacter sp. B05]OOG57801.1 dipeptidyl aminopeptidase [Rhodanobacter sp. B05]